MILSTTRSLFIRFPKPVHVSRLIPRSSTRCSRGNTPLFRPFSSTSHLKLSHSNNINNHHNPEHKATKEKEKKVSTRENIYTFPNLLTLSRIAACPILGWSIIDGNFYLATSILVYAGITDILDGYIARTWNMQSVLGTILDPAADKTLVTTLVATLAYKGLLPLPLAVIIFGRDVALSLSAFYIRYTSLPHPKTFTRYWDFSIPSAEVHPTTISKVNTALQLSLMGVTTISPILPVDLGVALTSLQWIVATTTVWSGLSYILSKDGFTIVSQSMKKKKQ